MKVLDRKRPFPHFKFPDEINISIKQPDDETCAWHKVPAGSFQLEATNYGWFPVEVLMGVIDGKYKDTYGIGAKLIGASACMFVANKEVAIEMLVAAGYECK